MTEILSLDINVQGIGFTVPHYFEGDQWIQRQTNNMPALEGFAFYPPLKKAFGPNIMMINDLSSAGIAEYSYGKGRDYKRMLLMAIGTGISTAMVTENGLVTYNWGTSGDTGHIIVDPAGMAECTCGGRGCLEAVAAAPAIRRQALVEIQNGRKTELTNKFERTGDLEASDVYEAATNGDPLGREIILRAGYFLGLALSSYLHIYRPNVIVLGGGVAQAGDLLVPAIQDAIDKYSSPWYKKRLAAIEVSGLGTSGGSIGCASLILNPDKSVHQ
ncbi:MAG: ROK family protein [Anaerolineaceae bacterium]|nr:ROK family protein [Anaerolineaceae bacterium]